MKIIDFVKKHKEIIIVNFIVLGFIAIIMLAQFGVHIKVDKGVDLVPVEIGYSQSTVYLKGKSVPVSECLVYLEYENNAQKTFWMSVPVVFGRADKDEIEGMIKDGDSIKRNVFINTKSKKVIGVTKSGKSIWSLYYYNSKMFRYGILILIIVDIFMGLMIKFINKEDKKTIDMSQYRYYPEDKRALELNAIIFQLREFWLLYFLTILFCALFGSIYSFGLFIAYLMPQDSTKGITATVLAVGIMIIFILFVIIPLSVIIFIRYRLKNKDIKNRVFENANRYLSNVGEDFLEQLQADINKGLPFMKKHNLVISENYVIGSITDPALPIVDPMAIPKEQIREIAYVYYTRWGSRYYKLVVQEVYFRLKNGKEIRMPVNDRHNISLTLKALVDCGTPIIDITKEKECDKYGWFRKR